MTSIVGTGGNDFIHVPGQGGTAPGFNDMPVATDTGDTIDGAAGNDRILAGAGADTIAGGLGDDFVEGGAGDDLLLGGSGGDSLAGGAGIDTVSYAASAAAVAIVVGEGSGSGGDAEGDTIAKSVETLIGSAFADTLQISDSIPGPVTIFTLEGGDGNDTLIVQNGGIFSSTPHSYLLKGGAGDDTLIGGYGQQTFIGGAGADTIVGSPTGSAIGSNNTVSYADSQAGIRINLSGGANGGAPGVGGDAQGDILVRVGNAIGSAFDDVLTGNDGANRLQGGDGNDILQGRSGDPSSFTNGDLLDGGNGFDTSDYGDSTAAVHVDLVQGKGTGGTAQGDAYISIEGISGSAFDDVVIGDNAANTFWGLTGNDSLSGGGGSDSLRGGAGDDLLEGGAGADRFDGGDGIDTVTYIHSALGVTVDMGANSGRIGDAQGDTFAGVENLVGSVRGDTLAGNSGANMLSGEDSNDRLTGAGGADVLNGGLGGDFFTYRAAGDSTVAVAGRDTIQDFNSLENDKIDLSQIDADGNAGNGNGAFTFIETAAFTGVAGQVRFEAAGDDLLVQADTNGDKVAEFAILVQGAVTLTAADFVL